MEFIVITFIFNFFINVIPLTYDILKKDELLIFKTMLHCLGAVIILGAPLEMGITTEQFYITEFIIIFSFIIPFLTALYQKKNTTFTFKNKNKVIVRGFLILGIALITGALLLLMLL